LEKKKSPEFQAFEERDLVRASLGERTRALGFETRKLAVPGWGLG
jgi:hypothetical protein